MFEYITLSFVIFILPLTLVSIAYVYKNCKGETYSNSRNNFFFIFDLTVSETSRCYGNGIAGRPCYWNFEFYLEQDEQYSIVFRYSVKLQVRLIFFTFYDLLRSGNRLLKYYQNYKLQP